jgi:hypothetical protein
MYCASATHTIDIKTVQQKLSQIQSVAEAHLKLDVTL